MDNVTYQEKKDIALQILCAMVASCEWDTEIWEHPQARRKTIESAHRFAEEFFIAQF